jgi:hypothetical protein
MATNVTSDNFEDFLAEGLQKWGVVTEQADIEDVQEIQSVSVNDTPPYTMPLVKQALNGQMSYVKISIPNLMNSIAEIVSTTGFLQAPTEEQFNEIFD